MDFIVKAADGRMLKASIELDAGEQAPPAVSDGEGRVYLLTDWASQFEGEPIPVYTEQLL